MSQRFEVRYAIGVEDREDAASIARAISIEQTIEFPYELVSNSYIKEVVAGRVESLEPGDDGFDAVISYDEETTAFEATQFLNVLFGNSSLQPHVWVKDFSLTPRLKKALGGPRFGLSGMRQLLQVPTRPMIQAVIKPMGTSTETLAAMCGAYTRGGVDVIKDDHGITDQSFSRFKERVARCADAVREANAQTGNCALYAANISGDGFDVIERAQYAKEVGATAYMITPGLVGFGWLHKLATSDEFNLPIISHPAMLGGFVLPGTSGIADNLWLGRIPRLMGADMPIFVSYGGRFTFAAQQCQAIARTIRSDIKGIKRAIPSPGGGVTDAKLAELVSLYGNDTMFLIGGDMFRRGENLEDNMKYFVSRLEELQEV